MKIYDCSTLNVIGTYIEITDLKTNYNHELITLKEYLNIKKNYDKEIILNIIPNDNISNNIKDITYENENYIYNIFDITKEYQNLNIKYASTSIRTVKPLIDIIKNNIGYIISNDLNYIDASFYILDKFDKNFILNKIMTNKKIYLIIKKENLKEILNYIDFQFYTNKKNIYLIIDDSSI